MFKTKREKVAYRIGKRQGKRECSRPYGNVEPHEVFRAKGGFYFYVTEAFAKRSESIREVEPGVYKDRMGAIGKRDGRGFVLFKEPYR